MIKTGRIQQARGKWTSTFRANCDVSWPRNVLICDSSHFLRNCMWTLSLSLKAKESISPFQQVIAILWYGIWDLGNLLPILRGKKNTTGTHKMLIIADIHISNHKCLHEQKILAQKCYIHSKSSCNISLKNKWIADDLSWGGEKITHKVNRTHSIAI